MPTDTMTAIEKQCVIKSADFLSEAVSQVGKSRHFNLVGELGLHATAEMLGELSAERYRSCMKAQDKSASPRPSR